MRDIDPEGSKRRDERIAARIEEFVAGKIGEATLEVSLLVQGLRGQQLAAEVSLARAVRAQRHHGRIRNRGW